MRKGMKNSSRYDNRSLFQLLMLHQLFFSCSGKSYVIFATIKISYEEKKLFHTNPLMPKQADLMTVDTYQRSLLKRFTVV
jgi:hypothetical protein